MKCILCLFYLLLGFQLNASEGRAVPRMKRIDPIEFFVEKEAAKPDKFTFNQYENIISGGAAFLIGNVGYMLTDSTVLGLTYSAIQTIGVINIGQGIYKMNSPSVERSFKELLTNEEVKGYSKKRLAGNLVTIFGKESRAKRLALFYSSSLLAAQYTLNATVYESSGKLKNVYIFLGGVNAIIAAYSAFSKSEYEEYLFGEDIDLNPFAFSSGQGSTYGATLTYSF